MIWSCSVLLHMWVFYFLLDNVSAEDICHLLGHICISFIDGHIVSFLCFFSAGCWFLSRTVDWFLLISLMWIFWIWDLVLYCRNIRLEKVPILKNLFLVSAYGGLLIFVIVWPGLAWQFGVGCVVIWSSDSCFSEFSICRWWDLDCLFSYKLVHLEKFALSFLDIHVEIDLYVSTIDMDRKFI